MYYLYSAMFHASTLGSNRLAGRIKTLLNIYHRFVGHFPIGLDFVFITFLLQEC